MPACYEEDYPVVFATELEAQREIADTQLTRIQQFLDGNVILMTPLSQMNSSSLSMSGPMAGSHSKTAGSTGNKSN